MNMNERLKEQLSAMVDGQLPGHEQELLVTRLTRDQVLAGCWHRYHLISDAIRRQLPEPTVPQLSDRIRKALRDEPSLAAPSTRTRSVWLKSFTGLAVAASVAFIAVLAVRTAQENSPPELVAGSAPVTQTAAVPNEVIRLRGMHWDAAAPKVANQLNTYLVNHGEYAVSGGMPSFGPHVQIVGYDTTP